jgi:hypothetical protein
MELSGDTTYVGQKNEERSVKIFEIGPSSFWQYVISAILMWEMLPPEFMPITGSSEGLIFLKTCGVVMSALPVSLKCRCSCFLSWGSALPCLAGNLSLLAMFATSTSHSFVAPLYPYIRTRTCACGSRPGSKFRVL